VETEYLDGRERGRCPVVAVKRDIYGCRRVYHRSSPRKAVLGSESPSGEKTSGVRGISLSGEKNHRYQCFFVDLALKVIGININLRYLYLL
jgi:hypothetical protein